MSGLRADFTPRRRTSATADRPAERWPSANLRRLAVWCYLNGSILLTRAAPSESGRLSAPPRMPQSPGSAAPRNAHRALDLVMAVIDSAIMCCWLLNGPR